MSRPYHSPLRARQASATRRGILGAAAELLANDGLADLSMRDVAARAGVAERTVYHHFPSRQALLDGLTAWVSDLLRERELQGDPRGVEDLPDRIARIFAAFEEMGAPARAMAKLSAAEGMRSAEHDERTVAFREHYADVLDPLPADEADRCFAVIRHLASSVTWLVLRDELGLTGADAGRAVAWAIETLVADLRARHPG